jgi:hypothetical protein
MYALVTLVSLCMCSRIAHTLTQLFFGVGGLCGASTTSRDIERFLIPLWQQVRWLRGLAHATDAIWLRLSGLFRGSRHVSHCFCLAGMVPMRMG